jgi:DNA-binding NtrC family response regulator
VELRIPALRDRRADILPLASRRLHECARKYQRTVEGFTADARTALESYHWPGNVRELNNVIERAVLLGASPAVSAADLRLVAVAAPPSIDDMSLEEAERQLLQSALRRAGGSVVAAAEALGLSRSAMYRRIEKLGVRIDRD